MPPGQDDWVKIPAQKDILIVNVGDLLQKWTNGYFKSCTHRYFLCHFPCAQCYLQSSHALVANSNGDCTFRVSYAQDVPRYSVPFFFNGNYDYIIEPLAGTFGSSIGNDSGQPKPFTVGSHIISRLRQTHVELAKSEDGLDPES